jgi:hypothetical protein
MVCCKCGYSDKKEEEKLGKKLCQICFHFSPDNDECFSQYIEEKIDWNLIDSYRKYGQEIGSKLKKGMDKKAKQGELVTRAPLGYNVVNGELIQNEEAAIVHSLFKTFLEKEYSLNSLAKNYGLSINGLKKVLTNRTYLGEIKFAGKLNKGKHQPLISPEIFYAVQRKLKEKLDKK